MTVPSVQNLLRGASARAHGDAWRDDLFDLLPPYAVATVRACADGDGADAVLGIHQLIHRAESASRRRSSSSSNHIVLPALRALARLRNAVSHAWRVAHDPSDDGHGGDARHDHHDVRDPDASAFKASVERFVYVAAADAWEDVRQSVRRVSAAADALLPRRPRTPPSPPSPFVAGLAGALRAEVAAVRREMALIDDAVLHGGVVQLLQHWRTTDPDVLRASVDELRRFDDGTDDTAEEQRATLRALFPAWDATLRAGAARLREAEAVLAAAERSVAGTLAPRWTAAAVARCEAARVVGRGVERLRRRLNELELAAFAVSASPLTAGWSPRGAGRRRAYRYPGAARGAPPLPPPRDDLMRRLSSPARVRDFIALSATPGAHLLCDLMILNGLAPSRGGASPVPSVQGLDTAVLWES